MSADIGIWWPAQPLRSWWWQLVWLLQQSGRCSHRCPWRQLWCSVMVHGDCNVIGPGSDVWKTRLSDTKLLADVCVHTEPSIRPSGDPGEIHETTGYPGVVIGKVLHRGCLCGRSLGDHRWGLIPWRWVLVAHLPGSELALVLEGN